MFHLACTRFTNSTYDENMKYREKTMEPVIYGTTLQIRKSYSIGTLLFVAEMNNDINKIEGIGLIKNLLVCNKRHKIYENNEYNRYIYSGKYWLNRSQIIDFDIEIVEILDNILFKGRSHLKRRTGITIITEKLFVHWNYDLKILKHKIKQMFLSYFKHEVTEEDEVKPDIKHDIKHDIEDLINNIIDKINNTNNENEDDEVYIEIIPKKRKYKNNIKSF